MTKFYEFWSCVSKVMDFWSWLSYCSTKFGCYFYFLELLSWKKIPNFLMKILHNIFQYYKKIHEFWSCILEVIKFWSKQLCFNVKFSHCIKICGMWGKFWKFYHGLLVLLTFRKILWILGLYFVNGNVFE